MAALAAAMAKKRAEKMGLQNEEVDDSNVGKQGEEATLKNPFLGKLKATPNAGPQLSPRSKRLADMAAQVFDCNNNPNYADASNGITYNFSW
jgi:hypothetical protein